jgi:hypothetical protein
MQLSKLQQAEFGYLYYSLYAYRRKIEADIRNIIKADASSSASTSASKADKSRVLRELTQKLRNISDSTSRVISLNKGYKIP